MLTVIVVSAAASFAIFTAQKQEELQKQEFSKLLRDSEQLQINRIEVEYNMYSYNLSNCTFFLTSQHQRDTRVNGLTLNELVLKRFHVDRQGSQGTERETWNFSRGSYRKNVYVANTSTNQWYLFIDNTLDRTYIKGEDTIVDYDFNNTGTKEAELVTNSRDWVWLYEVDSNGNPYLFHNGENRSLPLNESKSIIHDPSKKGTLYPLHHQLQISPMERIQITIENIDESFDDWFFKLKDIDNISSNTPIQFSVQTSLTNVFEKTFLPPIPNIEIRQEENSIILDGSRSFCEDEATIIEWKWEFNSYTSYGKQINANQILTDQDGVTDFQNYEVKWNIRLTVKNNYGMLGRTPFATHTQDFQETMIQAERLEFIDILPTYDDDNDDVKSVNITIKSNSKYDSNITDFWINNELNTTDMNISRYDSNYSNITLDNPIKLQQPITIKIKTALGNTFEKTFYPPNTLIRIQTESLPGGQGDYIILDGSQSDHPGDGYIVSWNWNVTNTTLPTYLTPEPAGRKVHVPSTFINVTGDYTYQINLTVVDNYRMKGKSTFIFEP